MTYEEIMAQPFIDNNPACDTFIAQPIRVNGEEWRAKFCATCGRHVERHEMSINLKG